MPFPFTAVVGMDDLRLALILNSVSPAIGGVLARGEKGTAKSTTVRALALVLPQISVVAGCRFACDPIAEDSTCPDGPHDAGAPAVRRAVRLEELPVGATEDRLVGSLDLEKALTEGVKAFEPGILASANRGVLYVDEVNLLHDHLVDLLLDAAALGTNYVERDGVSVRHASRFLLVGTMNPEEGELRPQLLDRFGLTVEVAAPREPDLRAEVVRRRLAYDADPAAFDARFAAAQDELAAQIATAQALLPSVELPDSALRQITALCASFDVDGLRADIVTARAAMAHAAWEGRGAVEEQDIRAAARLSLPHRRRRNPFDAPGLDESALDEALRDAQQEEPEPPTDGPGSGSPDPQRGSVDSAPGGSSESGSSAPQSSGPDDSPGQSADGPGHEASRPGPGQQVVAPSAPFRARRLEVPGLGAGAAGRRSRAITDTGQVTRALLPAGRLRHLHLAATIAAAAPHQRERGRRGPGLIVRREDLRDSQREGREGNLVLFVVDASGSMAARARMGAVKGAVLSLLLDAYQRRDKVGLISFRGESADLLLPPTSSVDAAAARLTDLPTGGRTPLGAGLLLAHETLRREALRDPSRRALVVVVTDGRHTASKNQLTIDPAKAAGLLATQRVASVVIDCESGPVTLGMAGQLAERLGAVCLSLAELSSGEPSAARPGQMQSGDLAGVVRALTNAA